MLLLLKNVIPVFLRDTDTFDVYNCDTELLEEHQTPVPSQGPEEGASAIYMEEEVISDDDLSTAMTDLANAILALSRYQSKESC